MNYKKDFFATFAYDFEHLRFLVKSFACAHGEIKGSRLWWNILLKQNVKLNPPTRRRGEFHTPQAYFTLQSNNSLTRKGGFSWKTDKSKLVGFSGAGKRTWTSTKLPPLEPESSASANSAMPAYGRCRCRATPYRHKPKFVLVWVTRLERAASTTPR